MDLSFPPLFSMYEIRYPSEAPKGKGGRVSVASGLVCPPVKLPDMHISELYRRRYRLQAARTSRVNLSGQSFKRLMMSFTGRFSSVDVMGIGKRALSEDELDYDIEAGSPSLALAPSSRSMKTAAVVNKEGNKEWRELNVAAKAQGSADLDEEDITSVMPQAAPDSPCLSAVEDEVGYEEENEQQFERAFSDPEFLKGL